MFDDLLRSERKEVPYVAFLKRVAAAVCRVDDECDADEGTIGKDVADVLAVMKSISNSPVRNQGYFCAIGYNK